MNRRLGPHHFVLAMCLAAAQMPTSAQVIHEHVKLLAADGTTWNNFGWSIAISEGTVAVGARWDDDFGDRSGSAYIYDAATGVQIAKLVPADGAAGDRFGYSIDIDDGIVVVGSWRDGDNGTDSGSAYLFDAVTGAQIMKLLPTDGAAGDVFGRSVAIDNGIVAVGAKGGGANGISSGAAYLFDAHTGNQLAKLFLTDGSAGDAFGRSIALDHGIVVVGAHGDDDNGDKSGSVYLFDASTGHQTAKLVAQDPARHGQFGYSIAIDHGIVAIGANGRDSTGAPGGSAYLFDAATGAQLIKIHSPDGVQQHMFGSAIAISQGVVAVGAWADDDNGNFSGSAYLFDAATGDQIAKLLPSDGAPAEFFGESIAIHQGAIAVGARLDDDNGPYSGSAYVFHFTCHADLNGDGVLDIFDVQLFVDAFTQADPSADLTGDGVWNFFDVQAFLIAFAAGCS